jgi:hypothetical protein
MSGVGLAVLILIIVGALWWIDVLWHPIRRCPSCRGTKKNSFSTNLRWGVCGRCGGKGEVRRFGRRE